jgi:hypothetical protein
MHKVVSLLFLLVPVLVSAGGIKKWVDQEGVVHFGDVPPVASDYKVTKIRPLSGGKGLSAKQLNLVTKLNRQEQQDQKAKFRAEKAAIRHYRLQKKIESAYRKGELVKGLSEPQIKNLLGEPSHIEGAELGRDQKWIYDEAKKGEPKIVVLENGLYSRHRNRK